MAMELIIDGQGHFSLAWAPRMIGTGRDDAQRALLPAEGDHGQATLRM